MPRQFYTAVMTRFVQETPSTRRFFFKVPELDVFNYQPGQFVTFDLPIESKVTLRSYSIASAPDGTNTFELVIVKVEEGLGTGYIFGETVGKEFRFMGPLGKFLLPEVIDRDLCFIATGTGIAPLRSMYLYILNQNIPHKNLIFVFGNRKEIDILYKDELAYLADKHPEFKIINTLSRVQDGEWSGPKGYVHDHYLSAFADKRPAYFYICGWSNMVTDARHKLAEAGYDKSAVKFEKYD